MQEPDSIELTPEEQKAADEQAALRAELSRLQAKRAQTKDRDIIAVLDMRINQIEPLLPRLPDADREALDAATKKEEEEEALELANLPIPTPAEVEQAERLIRQSRLEAQRGNKNGATDLLKQAIEVAPGSPVVIETMADDLLARKKYKEARAMLKRAHMLDPKNVALERKWAESVFFGGPQMSIEAQLRMGMNDSLFLTGNDNVAGIVAARLLSAFVPGVGQMVIGRTTKGLILFATYILCFGLIVIWQNDFKSLLLMFSKNHTSSTNPLIFIPIAGSIIVWIIAMADLSGGQSKVSARHSKVDRPKPPVDLPFD